MNMNRDEVLCQNKHFIIESFIGEDVYDYIEKNLGIDWRIAYEEERLTPYIENLLEASKYLGNQLKSRNNIDIVKELICSRVIEMRLIEKWKDSEVCLNGSDKDKLITEYSSYAPDLRQRRTDNYFEVISNYSGKFISNQYMYVRQDKINYLMEFANYHTVYIVAVDVLYKKYTFIPINSKTKFKHMERPNFYGVTIDLINAEWVSLYEKDMVG